MSAPRRHRQSCRAVLLAFVFAALLVLMLPAAAFAITQNAAANDSESYVIKSDGTLWSWGGNAFGGLGLGDFTPRGVPVQVGVSTDWKMLIDTGSNGMLALKQDGSMWRWGLPFTATPTEQTGSSWGGPWDTVVAGLNHVLALKNGGQLWAWGSNDEGQLGDGSAGHETPTRIGVETWKSVAGGSYHSLGVRTDGTLWAWGTNDDGQLGLGNKVSHTAPTQVGSGADWQAVFCGPLSSYALTTSGKLYAWGNNDFGQLSLGSIGGSHLAPAAVSGSDWADVAPGSSDCLAIKADGSLWACGDNDDGQLGLPADGSYHETLTRVGTATTWADVACGPHHTIAVTSTDEFAACGANQYGQIGLGYPLFRCSPEQIGTVDGWVQVDASISHSGGVRDDGTLWMWGNTVPTGGSSPAQVGTDTDWKSVSCGSYIYGNFTAALKTNGSLWTWGDNSTGQLGLGGTAPREIPTQVGLGTGWAAVACSDGVGDAGRVIYGVPYTLDDHVLAVKTDGTLWAWGANDYGQLGLNTTVDHHTPQRVGTDTDWAQVACGDDYSAALKKDGTLWVWGNNQFGQLGQGGTTRVKTPTQVTTGVGAETFARIACGSGRDSSHMLAVKLDGTLWGWGLSAAGELGQGPSGFQMYDSPIQIAPGTDWSEVACGSSFGDNYSLATKTNGELWAWGGNYRGQLGNGDYVPLYEPLAVTLTTDWQSIASGSNSFALKADGTLWAWGSNDYGQLGLGDPPAYSSTSVFPLESFTDSIPPTVVVEPTPVAEPTSRALARASGGWTRTPKTIRVSASDTGGAGISRTQISLTGGVAYATRSSVTVRNGDVHVLCRAIDRAGNRSAPTTIGHYKIDTTRPKPTASKVTVKRGKTAVLNYRITDYSPCTVRIVIKNSHGRVVKRFTIKGARSGSALTKSFRCTLRKGTYRWYVYATDSVGYKQTQAGKNKLSVK